MRYSPALEVTGRGGLCARPGSGGDPGVGGGQARREAAAVSAPALADRALARASLSAAEVPGGGATGVRLRASRDRPALREHRGPGTTLALRADRLRNAAEGETSFAAPGHCRRIRRLDRAGGGSPDWAGQIQCRDGRAAGGEQTDGGNLCEQSALEIGLYVALSDRAV